MVDKSMSATTPIVPPKPNPIATMPATNAGKSTEQLLARYDGREAVRSSWVWR